MTKKKLRWGILGVAKINDRLLPAFGKAANAELCAIASRALDRAQAAAAAARIPTAYGSYEALLDDPAIEAVYNPLPNTLHAEWTRKAAERGKHILCEKPLCPTADEAGRLVEFCRASGVTLMDGFMWPHHLRTARLRKFLDDGGIGEVRRVSGTFTFPLWPRDAARPANIRLRPDLAGGSLLDVGCYPVFGIRWALGAEPVRVYAAARYEHGVDVEMNGLLWFADGRTAMFDCGFTLPLRDWLEITGSKGVVRVPEMWIPPRRAVFEIYGEGRGEAREVVVEGEDQIVHMLEDFGRAVFRREPVNPPAAQPEEAVRTLRVLDALGVGKASIPLIFLRRPGHKSIALGAGLLTRRPHSLGQIQHPPAALAHDEIPLRQIIIILCRDLRITGRAGAAMDRGHTVLALGRDQPVVHRPDCRRQRSLHLADLLPSFFELLGITRLAGVAVALELGHFFPDLLERFLQLRQASGLLLALAHGVEDFVFDLLHFFPGRVDLVL
jgi:predicted dehydrogenase